MCKEDGNFEVIGESKWLGRKRDGDTHSFQAFLSRLKGKARQSHLERNHKGYNPNAH